MQSASPAVQCGVESKIKRKYTAVVQKWSRVLCDGVGTVLMIAVWCGCGTQRHGI